MLVKYAIVLALTLCSVPVTIYLWYDWSLEFIRGLKIYHTPELTGVMNFFSFIGDGEAIFYICLVFFLLGHARAFTFVSFTYVSSVHLNHWLKITFQTSRP